MDVKCSECSFRFKWNTWRFFAVQMHSANYQMAISVDGAICNDNDEDIDDDVKLEDIENVVDTAIQAAVPGFSCKSFVACEFNDYRSI